MNKNNESKSFVQFILLWLTQSLSALGSAMTSYALVLWLYGESGSALYTAMLTITSYAPYVLLSIFAGALCDRFDKKKTMLICDSIAALCTVTVILLFACNALQVWHLYIVNAIGGLMNTVQQPASEIASTVLVPEKHYQKIGGLRYFSSSLSSILTPVIATAVYSFSGLEAVLTVDLLTFAVAFITLMFFIRIPKQSAESAELSLIKSAKSGLDFLKSHKQVLMLIMYLSAINLVASMYEAVLPAMVLSRKGGGTEALGAVSTCVGAATLIGSIIATLIPKPKSRRRVICLSLLFSMSTENFFLAFGQTPLLWCTGAVLGWILIPMMSANLDVIMRTKVPCDMQGRVYSARNTLQFFTIPLGNFLGGLAVDTFAEPLMAAMPHNSLMCNIFGSGKGSGAALIFFIIGIMGVAVCLIFNSNKHIKKIE